MLYIVCRSSLLFAIILFIGCKGDGSQTRAADSTLAPPPPLPLSNESSRQNKTYTLEEFPVGISQAQTENILSETSYDVSSVPFGQVNKEIACHTISHFDFHGVDGLLKIVYDEESNKSEGGAWSAHGSSTRSDFKGLVKLISGHSYKGNESDDYMPRLFYTWHKNGKSFSLIYTQASSSLVILFSPLKKQSKEHEEEPEEESNSTTE